MQMLFGYSRPKGTRTTHPVNQPTNKHKHTHTHNFSVYDAVFQFVSDKKNSPNDVGFVCFVFVFQKHGNNFYSPIRWNSIDSSRLREKSNSS
jgi:hypothetical protein